MFKMFSISAEDFSESLTQRLRTVDCAACELTMRGLNGGRIFLCSSSVQSISLKKGWNLMASSCPWVTTQPRRLFGLLVMNWETRRVTSADGISRRTAKTPYLKIRSSCNFWCVCGNGNILCCWVKRKGIWLKYDKTANNFLSSKENTPFLNF